MEIVSNSGFPSWVWSCSFGEKLAQSLGQKTWFKANSFCHCSIYIAIQSSKLHIYTTLRLHIYICLSEDISSIPSLQFNAFMRAKYSYSSSLHCRKLLACYNRNDLIRDIVLVEVSEGPEECNGICHEVFHCVPVGRLLQ